MTPISEVNADKPFDSKKMCFQLGQWIDAKDTIDQWLEAQVTKIRGEQVFVHYNGWGNHWDEWIDSTSIRLAPFRTYTLQYPSSRYISPAPNIQVDAEDHEIPALSLPTFSQLVLQTNTLISRLQKCVAQFVYPVNEEEKKSETEDKKRQQLAAQLAPVLDRTGRLLCDFAPHFAHIAKPESYRDELNAEAVSYENDHVEVSHENQAPLIANSGDVSVISNLLDRVIFGDAPSLEVHVHAFLNQPPHIHSLSRPILEPRPATVNRQETRPILPLVPPMEQPRQSEGNCDTEVQTEPLPLCDASTSTDNIVTRTSIGVQANTETQEIPRSPLTTRPMKNEPLEVVKSPMRPKIKAHVGHTIIRESPKVNKTKCVAGNDFRITKTSLKMCSTVRKGDHK